MAATIGRVRAVFSASTSGLTGGVNQAAASMRKMQSSVSSLKGGLTALTMINGAQLFGSIASSATSAVRSLLSMGSAQAEVVDKTSKLASRLGMTYSELSGLAHAGDLAGVGLDTIGTAATKLDVAMVAAANGSVGATAKFAKLGLSAVAVVGGSDRANAALKKLGLSAVAVVGGSDAADAALQKLGLSSASLEGMTAPQKLQAMSDAISKLPDEADRAAAKVALLGQAGTDLGSMTAPQKLQAITDAISKLPSAAERSAAKLALLGQAGTDLGSMNAEERFQAIAEAISKLPNEAEKSAAAIAMFGKSGGELLPLFKDGAKGLQELSLEAEKFGKNLTNAQGVDVENMNDAFTRAQAAISGVVQQLVAYLAPAVDAITTAFSDMIGSVGGATIGQTIGDGIMSGARFMAQIADYVIANFSGVFGYFQDVGMKFGAVWDVAGRVVAFLSGVGNILKTVFLFAVSGLGFVTQTFLQGLKIVGELMLFDMSGMEPAIAAATAFTTTAFEGSAAAAGDAVKNFADAFGDTAPTWGAAAVGPVTTALEATIAKADKSAAAISEASKPIGIVKQEIKVNIDKASKPIEIVKQEIKVEIEKNQETQGIESRSAEGIKEMFRLMRGPTAADEVQEKQLAALDKIADNTEGNSAGLDEFDLAPGAGV